MYRTSANGTPESVRISQSYFDRVQGEPLSPKNPEEAAGGKLSAAERERLIKSHLRLVVKLARGFKGYALPMEDLVSEGTLGLIEAVDKFDPSKGFQLSSYATPWIVASMKGYALRSWSMVRLATSGPQKKLFFNFHRMAEKTDEEIAKALSVPLKDVRIARMRLSSKDAPLPERGGEDGASWEIPSQTPTPLDIVEARDNAENRKKRLQEALDSLEPREREVLFLHRLREPKLLLSDVARKLGLSGERIRQIEKQAVQKLRLVLQQEEILS